MPPLVVDEMQGLPTCPSHNYRHATIAQSDLCGFTQLASTKTPQEVVAFVSDLFGTFDALTDKHEVWKVETIGDAYIAGQAEEPLTTKNSVLSVILFGVDMVNAVKQWSRDHGFNVNCRVGVNHGECIGGVVGHGMQRYHLFGALLTRLDILESTAPEGHVQISKSCKEELDLELRDASFQGIDRGPFKGLELRTEPQLKTSKGHIHTYEEVGGTTYIVQFE